jgi:hypothetical protein
LARRGSRRGRAGAGWSGAPTACWAAACRPQVVVTEQYTLLVAICTEQLLQPDAQQQGREAGAQVAAQAAAQAVAMSVPRPHPLAKFELDGATLETLLGIMLSPRLMGAWRWRQGGALHLLQGGPPPGARRSQRSLAAGMALPLAACCWAAGLLGC